MSEDPWLSPTGQDFTVHRAIRNDRSCISWAELARHAAREAAALHPGRDLAAMSAELLSGFLRQQLTPTRETPGQDFRTDLLLWACKRVDWVHVARMLLEDLADEEKEENS
jgi:hypothetical protein